MSADLPPPKPSFAARVLLGLSNAIQAHRGWFFWPQWVLVAACIWFTIAKLEFHTSRNDLVGGDKPYHKIFLEFKKEFPAQDDLVVVVESEQLEKNRQFVERLGAKLEAARIRVPVAPGRKEMRETNLFANTFYKGDLKRMGPKALLFLPEKDLADLRKTLAEYRPFLHQFTRATNLVSLFDLVNTQIRTAREESNAENASLVKALPALERIVNQAADGLTRLGVPPSPGINALFEGGQEAERAMYLTYASGRIYLVTAQASSEELNGDAVERLRQLAKETQLEVPGLNVGLTGEPVLEFDEMEQSQKDSTLATVVSLVLVMLMFVYGYHETGRPLKATLCLLVGIAYTMGFTTLVVGHLNILTITFVPILVGLAIDFGVHLVTRYEEELWHGKTEREALEKAIVYTGMGIFTGAFTTAGAFFAMGATSFKGIQEMGIICGGGLLVCLVPMMTLLPALLLRGRQNLLDHQLGPVLDRKAAAEVDARARIENFWLRRPAMVIVVTLGLSAWLFFPARKVTFDYNLLHMQSEGLPAVTYQDKLIHSSQRSVLFGAVVAADITQATNLIAQLTNLPTVGAVESMAHYLTEDVTAKLAEVGEIKKVAAEIQFRPVDTNIAAVAELSRSLWSTHGYLTLIAKKVATEDRPLYTNVVSLQAAIKELRSRMQLLAPAVVAEKLTEFQQSLFNDVVSTFTAIRDQDNRTGLRVEDLPEMLRNRFIGVTGKHLLQVYPKHDVWDREAQAAFVKELRGLDPKTTGTPVQLLEYTGLLKKSFEEAAIYSLAAIVVLVFIHFRNLSCVLLSLLPVAIGALWMAGMMGLCGLSFNPANIMTLPLVIGVGVTNGIHILNRFAEEQHPSILAKSTGKAVLVSGLTTIAGFGSLVLAQHRGIESLGYIMATGTATCMLVGLTFLPAILNVLNRLGWTIKKTQAENARSTLGREEPRSETSSR